MGEAIVYVSLLFSLLALVTSAFCALRGAPAQLEAMARESVNLSSDTRQRFDAFIAEAQTILGAVQEERERAIRAQRRASADRVKVEGAQGNSGAPKTREEQLAEYRRQAGLI